MPYRFIDVNIFSIALNLPSLQKRVAKYAPQKLDRFENYHRSATL